MRRPLLVTHENMLEPRIFLMRIGIEGIVDRHDGTARIAADGLYIFLIEGAHQDLCAADLLPDLHTGPRSPFFILYIFLCVIHMNELYVYEIVGIPRYKLYQSMILTPPLSAELTLCA